MWTSPVEDDGKKCCYLIGLTEMGHAIFWRVSAGCSYVEHVHLMCVHEVGMVMTKSADWHTTRPGSGIYIQETGGLYKATSYYASYVNFLMTVLSHYPYF